MFLLLAVAVVSLPVLQQTAAAESAYYIDVDITTSMSPSTGAATTPSSAR